MNTRPDPIEPTPDNERWMDGLFRSMSDRLFRQVTPEDLAVKLPARTAASLEAIRRARTEPGTVGYQPPPEFWTTAMIDAAEVQIRHLQALVDELREKIESDPPPLTDDDSRGLKPRRPCSGMANPVKFAL